MTYSKRKRLILMIIFGVICLGLLAAGIVMFVLFPDNLIINLLFFLGASIFLFLSLFNMPIQEKERRPD